jgi:RNA polymerase sigma factor (sigma-70 family)
MPAALTKTIERLCGLPELTDGDLLSRFLQKQDAGAFETLLRRHGPLVLSVCRRILKNATDAEDAFQATFLVLLRTGRSIRKPESLASWLHGVARRTALHAKRAAARRRRKEAEVVPRETAGSQDLAEVLDEELAGLPEPYRAAILLCDLEGKTRKEAARELGCAEGTVASRLARGRSLLAGRLTRRGVTLAGAVLCSAVPAPLVAVTVKLAAGAVSTSVAALTQGVLKIMLLNKLRRVVGVLVLLAALTAGTGFALSGPGQADAAKGPKDAAARQAKEAVRTVTLGELSAGYADNDASGDERFAGKRVRVSGYVLRVKRVEGRAGGPPSYQLTLLVHNGREFFGYEPTVAFQFPMASRKGLAGLKREQKVTVEGQCEGRVAAQQGGEMILVRDCQLVAVEPAPPPGTFPPGMRPPGGNPMGPGNGKNPLP